MNDIDAPTMIDGCSCVVDASHVLQEPRFMYTTMANDPTSSGAFASLSEMLSANRDDAHFCEYLRKAQPGASYVSGGGAAPLFVTWRVA